MVLRQKLHEYPLIPHFVAALIIGHHLAIRPFAKRFGRELFLWRRLQAAIFELPAPRIVHRINVRGIGPSGPLRPPSKAVPRIRRNSGGSSRLILHAFVVQT
jgi:hypothetical protein